MVEVETPDDVLDGDYRELYYRWELGQWSSGEIDFTEDRAQWERLGVEPRAAVLAAVSSFYAGKEEVINALVAFGDAAPTEEQQVFLTTQLVDEARHIVLMERFYADVCSGPPVHEPAEPVRVLFNRVRDIAARVRRVPDDRAALVEGIALYHLMIEGVLHLTAQRAVLDHLVDEALLPGLRDGLTAVVRDEVRHASFGVRFLGETVAHDDRFRDVIRATVEDVLPTVLSAVDEIPYGEGSLRARATAWLSRRLERMRPAE